MITLKSERALTIGKTEISDASAPYLIAEIGTNHDQDIDEARFLIDACAEAGWDCAKFQIYEGHEIVSPKVQAADYGLAETYGDIPAIEMFDSYLKTPKAWFPALLDHCHQAGLHACITLHGETSIRWAQEFPFDLIKTASMDHTNLPLFEQLVAAFDVPVISSFGMSHLDDIDHAVEVLQTTQAGILHCVAVYPPTVSELRLGNIGFFRDRYPLPVGFSDHALGSEAAVAARSAGAQFFEKHITRDRGRTGPDHPFALQVDEMAAYRAAIREAPMGSDPAPGEVPAYQPITEREERNREAYLKSIHSRVALQPGEAFRAEDLYLARPGEGLPPRMLDHVLTSRAARAIEADMPLQPADLKD